MGGFAWVTLATNDSYSLGALVLAHSLHRVGTKHQLAVLVTPGVTQAMREKLHAVFDLVQEVNVLDSKDEANLALLARPELGITFTKLHCWRLTQYEKCVFVDADALVIRNCDELFEREELSAAPDVGWPDCFNSGVFVFAPSQQTFASITAFAAAKGSFDGGDQGLLNSYFSDWAHKDISKHLPFIYNMCSTATYSYLPAFKQFGEDARIVHFIGATKPWLQYFDTLTGIVEPPPNSNHLQPLLQLWWNIFCEDVHSHLSPVMASSTLAPIWHTFESSTISNYTLPTSQICSDETERDVTETPDFSEFDDPWERYNVKADLLDREHHQDPYPSNVSHEDQPQHGHDDLQFRQQPYAQSPAEQNHGESRDYPIVAHVKFYEGPSDHSDRRQSDSTGYGHEQSQSSSDHYQCQYFTDKQESQSQENIPESNVQVSHHHRHETQNQRIEIPHYHPPSHDIVSDEIEHSQIPSQKHDHHHHHHHHHQQQQQQQQQHHHQPETQPETSQVSKDFGNDNYDEPRVPRVYHYGEESDNDRSKENFDNSVIIHTSEDSDRGRNEHHPDLNSLPSHIPCTDHDNVAPHSEQNIQEHPKNEDAGLAGALAQLTLGEPRSAEQTAFEEHMRKQSWEQGHIDYMGRDSFDNIWKKICQTLSLASAREPTPPKEVPTEIEATEEKGEPVPVAGTESAAVPESEVRKVEASATITAPTTTAAAAEDHKLQTHTISTASNAPVVVPTATSQVTPQPISTTLENIENQTHSSLGKSLSEELCQQGVALLECTPREIFKDASPYRPESARCPVTEELCTKVTIPEPEGLLEPDTREKEAATAVTGLEKIAIPARPGTEAPVGQFSPAASTGKSSESPIETKVVEAAPSSDLRETTSTENIPVPIQVAESVIQAEPKESVSEDAKPLSEEAISSIVTSVQESATAISETLVEPRAQVGPTPADESTAPKQLNGDAKAIARTEEESLRTRVASPRESEVEGSAPRLTETPLGSCSSNFSNAPLPRAPEPTEKASQLVPTTEDATSSVEEKKKPLQESSPGIAPPGGAKEDPVDGEKSSVARKASLEPLKSVPASEEAESPVRPTRSKVPGTPVVTEATPPSSPPLSPEEVVESQPKLVKKSVKKVVKKTTATTEGEAAEAATPTVPSESEGVKKTVKKVVKKVVKKPKESSEEVAGESSEKPKKVLKMAKKSTKTTEPTSATSEDTPSAGANSSVPVPPKRKVRPSVTTKSSKPDSEP